jgi:hypothetical protein
LNLLLLLTALFASLTGGGSGDRAVCQVQGVAVVRAAEVAQAAVQGARAVLPIATAPVRLAAERPSWMPFAAAAVPAAPLPFERRLE